MSIWQDWSSRDSKRYNPREFAKKWDSFNGSTDPVTGGTIWNLAMQQGWIPSTGGHELDWDDTIKNDYQIIDQHYVEEMEIEEPEKWDPAGEMIRYLETLFEAGENVGYVVKSYQNDKGKYVPQNKGNWDRTAGQLIEELSKCKGDIGAVLGDYDSDGGAWIRFNPLDGNGVRNENVADFRYALVESDNMELEKQNAIIRELDLPVAVLMYSGGKSIHAIVRVEASDYKEYKQRVDYLYDVCRKNGMEIDTQNRNPSRLSRLPGVIRGDKKQFIIDTNIGKASWKEWQDWIESVNDDLPDMETMADAWDTLPELAPPLIDGMLRKGHKMLIAGPSKAGKSFLLIEMCIAIAEGKDWLGFHCSKERIMYVNLELDRASCLHRFRDVYKALGIKPENLQNIDIWNLRGKSMPMDKLAPKLIRRAQKKQYGAIIIDPIYKVITGDENSASEMSRFCNQFDKICSELGCSVIYCHHHSKGSQGQKNAMDRASGSGVFARDPDAHLDIIQLEVTPELQRQEQNKAVCDMVRWLLTHHVITAWDWKEEISQDDWLNPNTLLNMCENNLSGLDFGKIKEETWKAAEAVKQKTAWRIEGILREFPVFPAINIWFNYPVHVMDEVGSLKDLETESESRPHFKKEKHKKKGKEVEEDNPTKWIDRLEIAFSGCEKDGKADFQEVALAYGLSDNKSQTAGKKLKLMFGSGSNAREDFKERFESFVFEDGKSYLRRVSK